MTQIGKYLARSIHSPTARPQVGGPQLPEPARPKISDELSLRKKIESIYAGLLKTDFGKHLSVFGETAEDIEKRHGASLIRKLNAEPLSLTDGTKILIGDLLLSTMGIKDINDFRLDSETKKLIDEKFMPDVQFRIWHKQIDRHYTDFQQELPDKDRVSNLTRSEKLFVLNCCRYAEVAGESKTDAFLRANWNILQIRAIAAQSKLSDQGRDALVNLLNRKKEVVKERINPEESSFMTRLQYGLYLSVKKTADQLVADFKRDESWEYFTPDAGFDRRRDISPIKA